ncbi:MAG: AAA family ATPase, partial [Pseudomonadota bacterium]
NHYKNEGTPDLLIVETDTTPDILEYEIDALAEVCDPGTQLIVVGHCNDIALYQKVLSMGVANYLVYPVTVPSIISAISDVYAQPGRAKIGKIHAVVGAKGGAGSSTVAQNLALELSRRQVSDVLLVDLDLHFGTAALNLDVEANQGLGELIDQGERLDVATLDRVLVKRGLHLNLLGSVHALDHGQHLTLDGLERILEVAGSHISQIVLDIPHIWADWTERCLAAADTVTVVSTPELPSLRNAQTLMTQLKTLRPNDRPPKLVLNQIGMRRRQEISARDVASILKIPPEVSIPFEPKPFSRAEATGKMVTELGRSALTKAFGALADAVVPPYVAPVVAKAQNRKR